MVVEKEGRPVQSDGGLAGPRTALDGQELVERGPDDLVLLGLNGCDDVEHLARTCASSSAKRASPPRSLVVEASSPGPPNRSSATAITELRSTMI